MRKITLSALLLAAVGFLSLTTGCESWAKGDSGYAARVVPIHENPVVVTAAPLTETPVDR